MRRIVTCCTALFLVAGCGSRKESSGEEQPAQRAAPLPAIVLRDAGIRFEPPARWDRDRLEVTALDPDSTERASGASHGVAFDYKAEQPGNRNQPVLRILVFDRARWAARRAGPNAGEPIDSVGDWMFVALLPHANPYRPETLDAEQFDGMHLTLDEVRAAFAVEGDGPSLAKR